jgi:hypothetical protein
MIKWRGNHKPLTCSIASLVLSLLAIGSGIIAIQSTSARAHGPQVFYLANGTDNPDRIKKISSTRPRDSLKTTGSRYHLVQNLLPDSNACTWSDECYSGCCNYISQMSHVCDSLQNANSCAPNRTPASTPVPAPSTSPSPAPSAQMTEQQEQECLEQGGEINSKGECIFPDDNDNYKKRQ